MTPGPFRESPAASILVPAALSMVMLALWLFGVGTAIRRAWPGLMARDGLVGVPVPGRGILAAGQVSTLVALGACWPATLWTGFPVPGGLLLSGGLLLFWLCAWTDLRWGAVPTAPTLLSAASLALLAGSRGPAALAAGLLGALACAAAIGTVRCLSGNRIGRGDIRAGLLLGLLSGFHQVPAALSAMVLAAAIHGALRVIRLVVQGHSPRGDPVPLVPAFFVAAQLLALAGRTVLHGP